MTYSAIDATLKATRVAGDLVGMIDKSLINKALVRFPLIQSVDNQRELTACRIIMAGTYPQSWIAIVLGYLAAASVTLTNSPAVATDAQLDTAVSAAWASLWGSMP